MEKTLTDYFILLEHFWMNATVWEHTAFILKSIFAVVIMVFAMRLFQKTDNLYLKLGARNNRIIRVTLVIMMICAFFHDVAPKAPSHIELLFSFGFMLFMIELNVLSEKIISSKERLFKEIDELKATGQEKIKTVKSVLTKKHIVKIQ